MKYILLVVMLFPFFIAGMQPANFQRINENLVLEAGVSSNAAIRTLIEQGADVNYNDPQRGTPLFHASGWGNIEVMRLLLEAGANPNIPIFIPNLTFATPLSAVLSGFHQGLITDRNQALDAIKLLLSYGADTNHESVQKAITNHPTLAQLLKEAREALLSKVP